MGKSSPCFFQEQYLLKILLCALIIDNREHIRDIGKQNRNTKIFSREFKWEKRVPVL